VPTKVVVPPEFKAALERAFDRVRAEVADELVAKAMADVLAKTPVEDGHAHEAWAQSLRDVVPRMDVNRRTKDVLTQAEASASGDPQAAVGWPGLTDMAGQEVAGNGGWGWVEEQKGVTSVRLVNELLFVQFFEKGGTLHPIRPGGKKEGNAHKNPFLHPRTTQGRGMLVWEEGGQVRRSPTRVVRGLRIVDRAMRRASRLARRYGRVSAVGGDG